MKSTRVNRRSAMALVLLLLATSCGTRLGEDAAPAVRAGGSAGGATSDELGAEGFVDPDTGVPLSSDAAESVDPDTGLPSSPVAGADPSAPGADSSAPGADSSAPGAASSGDAAAAATGPSDEGVSDTEIRIGVTAPLSGLLGSLGEQVVGSLDSYFRHVNDQGGINGRKIRLVVYDDRGDAAQVVSNFRRLYEEAKVLIIIPFLAGGVEDYVTRNEIPVFDIGVEPAAWSSNYPTIHPVAEHPMAFTHQLTKALKDNGKFKEGMKVGMLHDAAITDYVPAFKEAWELAGAEVVSADPLELTDDCTPLVLKMRQLEIDYWDFETASWIQCISAAQRQGYTPPAGWGNWPASLQFLVENAGPHTDGLWSGNFVDRIDGRPRQRTKAHEEMEQIIGKYRPKLAVPGQIDAPTTMSNWIIAHIVEDALKAQGGTITKKGINDYVHGIKNYETGLATPILSMAADCKTGTGTAWFGQWSWASGQPQIVPRTGYLRSPFEEHYGGQCYLTQQVDKILG